jgi:hypothetical protein
MCVCVHMRAHVWMCVRMHEHVACWTLKLSICSSDISVYAGHRVVINSVMLGHDTQVAK